MLDYEWVNPSTIILAGNETASGTDSDQTHRNMFNQNYTMLPDPITPTSFSHHHHHFNFNPPQQNQHHPFFDPRAFQGASTTFSSPPSMLSLNPILPLSTSHCGLGPGPGLGLYLMPKSENAMNLESSGHGLRLGFGPGLGLNLGGLTYFPSDDIAKGLNRPVKTVESISAVSSNSARCQAEGCNANLSNAKHYHRRHKVCEYHSKAATVVTAGLTQRFCQQCSRLCFFFLGDIFHNDEFATGWCSLRPIIGFRVIPRAFLSHLGNFPLCFLYFVLLLGLLW